MRVWASADTGGGAGLEPVPPLDGRLLFDPADLAPFEDDFGHLIHRTPRAVLEPGSVNDIAVMIAFCARQGLPVAPRGQGHQTYGQAQVDGGLVIDMTPLSSITVDPAAGTASVGAGALWSALLHASLTHGLTPPVFTDYIELSVGGTLAAGGFGGASQRFGAQVDNVTELEVVTGTGEVHTCSAAVNADLFHAALAGLGQVAVITRCTVRLVPAPTMVRTYNLAYPTAAGLMAAQRLAAREGRFDWLEGSVSPVGAAAQFALQGASYFTTTPPDDAALLAGLGFTGTPQTQDVAYADFINQLAPVVAFLKSTGEWFDPHPWLNLLVPDADADTFVSTTVAGLTADDIGASGLVLVYPVPTQKLKEPLLRVPRDGEFAFLFSILRTASPDTDALPASAMLAANSVLYHDNQSLGGTQYPVGSIPGLTARDWRQQYGGQWPFFAAAKHRYDPQRILTPGQGIFPPPVASRSEIKPGVTGQG
ncbi:FAD-binding protein [Catenulispora sp. GP43]|uniref:FAD-binding protein n=1 Tax=Catenulispora sp. GP43 TaxID=3156263 RepID=UPI0035141535